MNNTELALLFQHFGLAIQKLPPADLVLLLKNKATFDILVKPLQTEKIELSSKSNTVANLDFEKMMQQLDNLDTREEGIFILKALNRIQLCAMAKNLSISVDGSANKEKLIEKIVERRIGLRLRQDAFSQVMNT